MSDANAAPGSTPGAVPGADGNVNQPAGGNAPPEGAPAGNQAATGSEPGAEAPGAAVTVVAYEPTNNPALDMTLEFIGNLGIGPEDSAMKAAMDGNFDQLEALLRGMGDKAKGFERFLALGKDAYGRFAEEAKTKAAQATAAIHDVVGGEVRWKAIEEWAKQNAEPAEKEAVNAALSAGGIQARAVAFYLNHRFQLASGTTVEPTERVSSPEAGGGRGNGGNAPLSPKEYTSAVAELSRKNGGRIEGTREYSQLQARRRAYRG